MSDAAIGGTAGVGVYQGYGGKAYRGYVLFSLLIVYTFNFIDRILISILNEPVKEAFGVTDTMMGLLGGPTFAVLYTVLGIPIALLAERTNRVWIITIAMAIWSAMTALCGTATTFWQLLLARVGVGIGEAGSSPPSHSLISDYFPADRRASALAIFGLGVPLGSMLAAVGGGWLAQNVDWRAAFLYLGLPGLILAIVFRLTVREPPRATHGQVGDRPSVARTFVTVMGKSTFWLVALGGAVTSFVGYGVGQFLNSYFMRVHELGPFDASLIFGVIGGLASALGVFLGGFLADRLAGRVPAALCVIPGVSLILCVPIYLAGFLSGSLPLLVAFLIPGAILHYMYLGPMLAVPQGIVEPRMRATASALLLFVVNIIGYGMGPPAIGFLSDLMAGQAYEGVGAFASACAGGVADSACQAARASGLQSAILIGTLGYALGGLLFLAAARTLKRDFVA